ncbi:hypothetical protein [Histidinibacterium aquaticum]|uniref:Uncharacterized protein n=1 Tax=Histidinibacterium aquaticum TaxID=2613962 RepID=A0A5J5GCP4_9RHOB|nr:hypothetical protein [Histidinibacterium aquaticum]KAA9005572.1 hypothetical protein F3S47_16850 [Histidinibacterium aquaticum]
MAVTRFGSLAARAPVPIFAAIGPGRQADVERLLARRGLRRAHSPRDAAVLLVSGDLPDDMLEALSRVHAQLPHPRATVRWIDETADEIADRLRDAWHDLCAGVTDEEDRLPDVPPNEWKGVGPHGQGGEGMMGGTPYGRSMAMTGPDIRDGLQLDRYTARIGPFAPMLPPGLVLEVTLQGDVICDATVANAAFAQPAGADAPELCAGRVVRLLGLEAAADRLIEGKRPGAVWLRGAVPSGLGLAEGTEARGRLGAWLAGEVVTVAPVDLPDFLEGAEWSEAALLLASLPPSAIIRATRPTEVA